MGWEGRIPLMSLGRERGSSVWGEVLVLVKCLFGKIFQFLFLFFNGYPKYLSLIF